MKKEIRILVFLFLLAFLLRIIFLFSSPIKIWDETVYANLGYDLSKNPLDYSVKNNGWSDFIPGKSFYSWPKLGFRAPLLPYSLSILYFLRLNFLSEFFIPFIGALSVVFVYFLGKKLFGKDVAFYSALFFLFIPLHVTYSAKILTDVLFTFFVLLTFLSFWKGYQEENKTYKILFGFFLALSLLSRYTALWIMPIFLFYFLVRDKSLKFLRDKYLWYSILAFFLTLVPWFIYGTFEYNNPLGAFIHGFKASAYWGGIQSWYFFFNHWLQMFSVIGLIFLVSLIYILYKKDFLKKEVYFLLIWLAFFLGIAIYMPHKEDRFLLPIVPVICLISGYFINKIKRKQILTGIFILIIVSSLTFSFILTYKDSYTKTNLCFLEANKFLLDKNNSLVITDESPIIYYYTKKETHFYPSPWSLSSSRNLIDNYYPNKEVYIFFTDFDMPLNEEENIKIKNDLDNNFKKVYECQEDKNSSIIYKFS